MNVPHTTQTTALLTAMHLLVDGICACSIFMLQPSRGGVMVGVLFVTYNVLAFMTQPLVGLWTDRRGLRPRMLWSSVLLLLAGALLAALYPKLLASVTEIGLAPELPLLATIATLLGIGNSLFHVYGGKAVTEMTHNDPRHLGCFVSSGALGLALGGAFHSLPLLMTIGVALTGVAASTAPTAPSLRGQRARATSSAGCATDTVPAPNLSKAEAELAGVGLFMLLLVFIRSSVGNMKPNTIGDIAYFTTIASVLAFAGKASGGFLARRYGVWTTLTATLMLSGMFLLLSNVHWAAALAMVLCINLTMPLTLHLANRSLPHRAGFAFGALAFMLIPGHALGLALASSSLAFSLLCTLVATVIIEALVLMALGERRWQVMAASVAMNILTNVPLNLAIHFVPVLHTPTLPVQIALESVVVCVETALFFVVTRSCRTALRYALLCNVTSYLCGLLFSAVLCLL